MRIYELCLIFHNDTTEEQQDQIFQSVADIIAQHSGSVLKTEKWGKKNFKFVIKVLFDILKLHKWNQIKKGDFSLAKSPFNPID